MQKKVAPVLISYTIAYILCTIVLNYVLNLAGWITEAYDIVKEYFILKGVQFFVLDYFVIAAYLIVGHLVAQRLGATSNCHKLLVVAAVICAISGAFWALFTSVPALRGCCFNDGSRVGPKARSAIYIGTVVVFWLSAVPTPASLISFDW